MADLVRARLAEARYGAILVDTREMAVEFAQLGVRVNAVAPGYIQTPMTDKLTDDQKLTLETWFYACYDDVRRQLDLQDKAQVAKDKAGGDITVVDWPQAERDKFRVLAAEAWEETAGKSPEARAALDAHYEFMKTIGLLE